MATVTKTVTLTASGYTGLTSLTTNSNYPVSNGYTDASSTTYARLTLSTSTAGYLYYTFDTSDIPSGATITSITARGKARVNNTSRVTNTVMQLYTGTTAKGSNTTFAVTTASTQNLTPGTWTRSELDDLRLRVGATGSSSTSTKRFDFYGADVTITYTVAVHTISASGDGTLDPSTSQTIESGGSYSLKISGLDAKPTVTDNGTDVTSSLTEMSTATETLIPSGNTVSGFTASNITNCYADKDNDTYATLSLAGGTTGTVYLDLADLSIPSGATITSVSCKVTLQFSRNNSSSGFTSSMQMYAGSTAKGSATQWVSSATDVAKTTYTLTIGSWTETEINSARFYLTATNSASQTVRYVYIYGISFDVEYESDGVIYVYTISSVTADHTIVVSAASAAKFYIKVNGTWTQVSKIYRKVGGSWVEQDSSGWSTLFSTSTNYRKMN